MYDKMLWEIAKEYQHNLDVTIHLLKTLREKFPHDEGFSDAKCVGIFFHGYVFEIIGKGSTHIIEVDKNFLIRNISNYQTEEDDSDNYERHMDGK